MRRLIVALSLVTACTSVLGACKKGDDAGDEDDEKTQRRRRERREQAVRRREFYNEATRNLGSIETGSKSKYQMETDVSGVGEGPFVHSFCPSSIVPVPETVPKGEPTTVAPKAWEAETWKCLRFTLNAPTACQYTYESAGYGTSATYRATAVCDPDGTGEKATFILEGKGSETGDAERVKLTLPPDA